jgi:hypothetical protein
MQGYRYSGRQVRWQSQGALYRRKGQKPQKELHQRVDGDGERRVQGRLDEGATYPSCIEKEEEGKIVETLIPSPQTFLGRGQRVKSGKAHERKDGSRWKIRTMNSVVKASSTARVSPMMSEWKITPNSRIATPGRR